MALSEYRRKRRSGLESGLSPEPSANPGRRRINDSPGKAPGFVIQHHAARSDHYDFRLEIDGVLVSWAVPKGPSTNPNARRKPVRSQPESVLSGRTLADLADTS